MHKLFLRGYLSLDEGSEVEFEVKQGPRDYRPRTSRASELLDDLAPYRQIQLRGGCQIRTH